MNTIIVANSTYSRFQRKLIETAFSNLHKLNPLNRYRHFSIITDRKKVVEIGWNDEKVVYNNIKLGYLGIHSEYAAIRKFLKYSSLDEFNKLDLYNLRISRYNQLANSRPCNRCSHLLTYFNPRHVYYSNEVGEFQKWK